MKIDFNNSTPLPSRTVQSGPGSDRTTFEYAAHEMLEGNFPIRWILPIPPPTGTVHLFPLVPSQSAVIIERSSDTSRPARPASLAERLSACGREHVREDDDRNDQPGYHRRVYTLEQDAGPIQ